MRMMSQVHFWFQQRTTLLLIVTDIHRELTTFRSQSNLIPSNVCIQILYSFGEDIKVLTNRFKNKNILNTVVNILRDLFTVVSANVDNPFDIHLIFSFQCCETKKHNDLTEFELIFVVITLYLQSQQDSSCRGLHRTYRRSLP